MLEKKDGNYFNQRRTDGGQVSKFVTVRVLCGNPVRLVDPDGRDIWVGEYKYTQGSECPKELNGDNAAAWNSLNSLAESKLGGAVVSTLCDSKRKYSIKTGCKQKNNTYRSNNDKENCGGNINLVERIGNIDKAVPHELFHAYQDEKGQYGGSAHNEVEAFMFEAMVCNEENGGNLTPNEVLPMTDPYVKVVFEFAKWNDNPPISAEDFNNVFRPIRTGFIEKSSANSSDLYNNISTKIPNRNLLRELIVK